MKHFRQEPKDENGDSTYLAMRDIQPAWHLHDGYMRLYIVGGAHQPQAMFPVTAPSSSSVRHGTIEEREIAEKAVEWLRENCRDMPEAGSKEIRAALVRFGWKADPLTKYPA